MRRRRGRRNPTGTTWAVLGVGALLAGAGIYYLTKKPAGAAVPTAVSSTSPILPSAQKTGLTIVYTDPSGRTYTRDQATTTACQLIRIGQSAQAAFWENLVKTNGGSLPC